MKKILILIIFLAGCATTIEQPTPFETTDKIVTIYGCEQLKADVAEKNKTLPADKQLEADC